MRKPCAIIFLGISLFLVASDQSEVSLSVELNSIGNQTKSDERYCVLQPKREKRRWELLPKKEDRKGLPVNFRCKDGFKLSIRNPYNVCEEYWDLSKVPICKKLCPQAHASFSTTIKCFDEDNQEIGCDEATDGSYLKYTCVPFYEPPREYNTTIQCIDGHWDAPEPTCRPECGKSFNSETNGNELTKYPWTAAMFIKQQGDFQLGCVGSITSEQLVLLAAHCMSSPEGDPLPVKNYQVVAGILHRKYKDPRDPNAQYLQIQRFILHPTFRGPPTNYVGDVGLIVTKEKFVFNEFVQPVCFSGVEDFELKPGDVGVVTAWGIAKPESGPSELLKSLEIPYKHQATCVKELPKFWTERFYTPDKLCAGLFNQSRSLCKGDSGAGLYFKHDGRYFIHGIVSVAPAPRDGRDCDKQQNALYTNVSYHSGYINSILDTFSVKQCELPPYPDNGIWTTKSKGQKPGDSVPSDTEMVVSCDDGYKLSPQRDRILCHSSFMMPTCQPKCPPPRETATSFLRCLDKNQDEVSCNEAIDGASLTYNCRPLHEPPFGYESTIFCVQGEWNSPGPVCNPICGKKAVKDVITLIHGGKLLEVVEYPWITALYRIVGGRYKNICGGTILSQRVVLTAAHCVTNDYGDALAPENHMVAAGKLYNEYQDTRDPKPQYLQVFRIISHSSYKGSSRHFSADIAVLITREPFVFNFFVHPVCFEGIKSINLDAGDTGIVTGWGLTEDGEVSDQLRVLEIPYKDPSICASELPSDWEDRYNLIDKLCAGVYNKGKGVCQGDSGGGLFYQNKDTRYYLRGVVSLGHAVNGSCDFRQNSLYTNVAFHYDFVNREFNSYHLIECTLPPHPDNGKWIIEDKEKKPGDTVLSDTVMKIICNDGFRLSSRNAKIKCESVFLMPKCQNVSTSTVGNEIGEDFGSKLTCIYDDNREGGNYDKVNITLCTHLIFHSVGLTQDGAIKIPQTVLDKDLRRFVGDMKKKNSQLKALVSVYGTGNKDTDEYPAMAASAKRRNSFVENAIKFLEDYNFDGLNIHWDVPLIKDRENYGTLLKKLRDELKPEWLLTATVHYSPINLGYNHIVMYDNLDWINVECYGFYGAWSLYTGQNAALYSSSLESDFEKSTYNLKQCAENWLLYSYQDKISLGVTFFGRYYTLVDPNQHGIHVPVTGFPNPKHTDRITYADICEKYRNWTRVWDDEQKNPYKYHEKKWVGYDDQDSIKLKVAYIKDSGFYGVSAFPINGDDIRGKCGPKQALLQQIHDSLSEGLN